MDEVGRLMEDGKVCVLEIDVKGAQQIKERHSELDCNFMFITCSADTEIEKSLKALRQRLLNRGTETEEQIQTRLNTSRGELEFLPQNTAFFDCVLVNEDLDECVKEMTAVLKEMYPWMIM